MICSNLPTFNVIILQVETMAAMRAVFDFHAHKVIIDGVRFPMQPRELHDRSVYSQTFVEIFEEPSATKELTRQAVDILDANHSPSGGVG